MIDKTKIPVKTTGIKIRGIPRDAAQEALAIAGMLRSRGYLIATVREKESYEGYVFLPLDYVVDPHADNAVARINFNPHLAQRKERITLLRDIGAGIGNTAQYRKAEIFKNRVLSPGRLAFGIHEFNGSSELHEIIAAQELMRDFPEHGNYGETRDLFEKLGKVKTIKKHRN